MVAPLVLRTPKQMTAWSLAAQGRGERLAFVPTMGALHAGHLRLLEEGRRLGDRLVLSIFINPTQFGPSEDLAKYPSDLDGDLALAKKAGTDVAFVPEPADMYPPGYQTAIEVEQVSQGLCGASRPGHFSGVATVVAKLFHIVRPHVALFGEKDFQQLAVIRRMVLDLDMGIEIVGVPTVREPDGLAMSSRNRYLGPEDRRRATALVRALEVASAGLGAGERRVSSLVEVARAVLEKDVDRIDYVEIRDAASLEPIETIGANPAVMAIAAFVGGTRLIDNRRLGPC